MRFLLSFLLFFVCVFANAQQTPPMKLGGPQGIEVNRSLNKFWMSVPIYVDTPVAPLTGSGWPGSGYIIQASKNYRNATVEQWLQYIEAGGFTQLDSIRWQDNAGTIYFLPKGIDTSQVLDYALYGDTSLWHYTGRTWRRTGGNSEFYFNYLLDGGNITQVSPVSSRQFIISPAEYYISGVKYKYDTAFRLQAPSKAADSTGRIDVITIASTGPRLTKGTPSRTPYKPRINSDEIELSTIYFRPFDTIPSVIGGSGGSAISSIYRLPGKDSIYYTIDTITFKLKDSVGLTTASNGLTASNTNVKLGGSLIENTNINLSSRRLSIIAGSDTTRFFTNGGVSIGGSALDSLYKLNVNGNTSVRGILDLNPTAISGTAVIRNQSSNDGSFMFVASNSTIPSSPPARNVIIDPVTRNYTTFTSAENVLIGRSSSSTLTSGNQNVFIGTNAGNGITTGSRNVILGTYGFVSTNRSNSIIVTPTIRGDSALFGLTNKFAFIGGGSFAGNDDISDFYFGIGHRTERPQSSHINFYAPSAWPSKADTIGSNFTINAGRGTGTGLGGSVIFRTSSPTTSGTTLQTLSERARITPAGNLLVGTASDSTFRLNVSGRARISDTLTLSTTPVTADTSANDLLVINSSNGQVRRFTGAFPSANPTLQQVTTAGNSTTDSINVIDGSNNRLISLVKTASGPPTNLDGVLNLKSNWSNYSCNIYPTGLYFTGTGIGQNISFPDSSGINSRFATRVKINNNTFSPSTGGLIDLGDLWINGSATLDFGNTSAQNSSDLTVTVTGAADGDVVSLGVPNGSVNANTCFTAWVSATNTVTVRFNNYSSGAVDPASGTFKIKVLK